MQVQKLKPGYKQVKSRFGKELQIPEEWKIVKIKDVGDSFGDSPFGSLLKSKDYRKSGIPILQGRNIQNNKFVWTKKIFVSKEKFETLKRSHCNVGDLVLQKIGTIGAVAIVPKLDNNDTYLLSTNMMKMSVNKLSVDIKFLFYMFTSNEMQKAIQVIAGGNVQPIFNFTSLKKLKIIKPPLEEQKKIASILSNVDSLLSSYDDIIQRTKVLIKGLKQKLLTKGIGHTKFKKMRWHFNQEIEIPEPWEITHLSEVSMRRKSSNIESNLYVGIENIESRTGTLIFKSDAKDYLIKKSFKKNDILYSKLRPYLEKVWYAKTDGFCSSDIYPLVPHKKINSKYLFYVLLSSDFLKFANATTAGGNIPKTRWDDIKNFKLFLPTMKEQEKIIVVLNNVDSKILDLKYKKSIIESVKKGLMQKLLTGQIRV